MVSDGTDTGTPGNYLRWWLAGGMLAALILVAAVASGILSQDAPGAPGARGGHGDTGGDPSVGEPAPTGDDGAGGGTRLPGPLVGKWCAGHTTGGFDAKTGLDKNSCT